MNTIVSESRKIFSLRSTWVYLAIITVGLTAANVLMGAIRTDDSVLQSSDLAIGAIFAVVIMIFSSATLVGGDLQKGTVAWSYLSTNRRLQVLSSQIFVITVANVAAAALAGMLGMLFNAALGSSYDFSSFVHYPDNAVFLFTFVEYIVYTLLATGLAYILRSGTFAAMLLIIEYFVIESVLTSMDMGWAKYILQILPDANLRTFFQGQDTFGLMAPQWASGVIVLAMVVAVLGGAAAVQRRRAVV
ncbi:ABC transporter permease [Corynebacterium segmentosum]